MEEEKAIALFPQISAKSIKNPGSISSEYSTLGELHLELIKLAADLVIYRPDRQQFLLLMLNWLNKRNKRSNEQNKRANEQSKNVNEQNRQKPNCKTSSLGSKNGELI